MTPETLKGMDVFIDAFLHREKEWIKRGGVAMDYFDGMLRANAELRASGVRKVGLVVDPALEPRTGRKNSLIRWHGGCTGGYVFSSTASRARVCPM